MPDKWVLIEHPSVKNAKPGEVTEKSYKLNWKPRGWKIVTEKKES
jgi:hypothetical protein